jgi:ribosomal protein S6--L-glutamate ligase
MRILFLLENLESQTAINLIQATEKCGYQFDVIPYFQGGLDQCAILKNNGRSTLIYENRTYYPEDYDGALLWCWGTASRGREYLRIFEDQGVPVLNSTYHTEITDSKVRLTKLLKKANISIPHTIHCDRNFCQQTIEEIESSLGSTPYVFKPDYGTKGIGISFVQDKHDLVALADKFKNTIPQDIGFIVQKFIGDPSKPIQHYRVFVIGDYVIPTAMQITALTPMTVSNISAGGKAEFIEASQDLKNISLLAKRASGLNIAGIDVMMSENNLGKKEYFILEVNDGPGTKTFDKQGINVSSMVIEFFINSLEQRQIA